MFYLYMSTEHLTKNQHYEPEHQKGKVSKVDINILMEKVREEKKKKKKENLIFVGLITSAVIITGAIASF